MFSVKFSEIYMAPCSLFSASVNIAGTIRHNAARVLWLEWRKNLRDLKRPIALVYRYSNGYEDVLAKFQASWYHLKANAATFKQS